MLVTEFGNVKIFAVHTKKNFNLEIILLLEWSRMGQNGNVFQHMLTTIESKGRLDKQFFAIINDYCNTYLREISLISRPSL